jgi:hypothetical protein
MVQIEEKQITRKQQALIVAMLSHETMDEACKAAGCGRASAYRWLKSDPTFQREWNDAKRESFGQAIAILTRSATTFASVLETIAADKSAPMTARVSACRAGLEWSTRGIETGSIAADARTLADELRARKVKV